MDTPEKVGAVNALIANGEIPQPSMMFYRLGDHCPYNVLNQIVR